MSDSLDLEEGGFSSSAIYAQAALLFERATDVAAQWTTGMRDTKYSFCGTGNSCDFFSPPLLRYVTTCGRFFPCRFPCLGSTNG